MRLDKARMSGVFHVRDKPVEEKLTNFPQTRTQGWAAKVGCDRVVLVSIQIVTKQIKSNDITRLTCYCLPPGWSARRSLTEMSQTKQLSHHNVGKLQPDGHVCS